MLPQWLIEKKRDQAALTDSEINFFVAGYVNGAIPDYQMAAMLMAIAIRGLTLEETCSLTRAMLKSGLVLDTSAIPQPKIDKHSTGGVGDKISLALAPLVAGCGVAVPMMVGRGLGITGGTLDKLEAIPGYRPVRDAAEFISIVKKCGCAIAGASAQLAPADKKIYALRDVTGTVESIPLIAASILSKKLAAGLDGIVFDVKWGRGAFMKTLEAAARLGRLLVEIASRFHLRAQALLTDMNQPLGRAVGNALEVVEALETLRGRGPADVRELTLALGEKMLLMAGLAGDKAAARRQLLEKINSGAALARFKLMAQLHGGQAECLEDSGALLRAGPPREVKAESAGYVQAVDAELIGKAALVLGAGRTRLEDKIDHSAGVICLRKTGDQVARGAPLAALYAASTEKIKMAEALARQAYAIGAKRVAPQELIVGEI